MKNSAQYPAAETRDSFVAWESPVANALWLRTWRLGEWLQGPLSPLFRTFLLPILVEARERGGNRRFGQRLPRMWRVKSPAYCVVNGYFFARADPRRLSLFFLPARFLLSEALGGWTERWLSAGLPAFLDRIASYQTIEIENKTSVALLSVLDELALDVAECWYAVALASGGSVPLKRFLASVSNQEISNGDVPALLRGFRTKTIDGQFKLFEIAQKARNSTLMRNSMKKECLLKLLDHSKQSPVPQEFQQFLSAYLDNFGHQVTTLDFLQPCLGESPSDLALALRAYSKNGQQSPQEILLKTAAERDQIVSKLRARLPSKKQKVFDRLLVRLQSYEIVLADTVFEMQRGWPIFRRVLLELGSRLVDNGELGEIEDIFFLEKSDLWNACGRSGSFEGLASKVEENRRIWKRQQSFGPPRCIPTPGDDAWKHAITWPINLREIGAQVGEGGRALRGIAASPGKRTGRARVCLTLDDASSLKPGEVLIAPRTTPNWTPLFSQVLAVVTDVGAATSHSSTVAREFCIPAVVGTQQATRVIKSGDLVTVDGTAGEVRWEQVTP